MHLAPWLGFPAAPLSSGVRRSVAIYGDVESNTMTDEPEWRSFERLVTLIESEAAPRGAVVKSPDHIPDIDTGQPREVDASIRFRAGTIDILVVIECRRRKEKDDVTWIEQLATKREKVGAAKIIAVSAAGFTKPAIISAKRYGIELRELSNIKPEDLDDWFLPHGICHLFRSVEDVQCIVHFLSSSVETIDAHRPLFRHELVHGKFPAVVLLSFAELKYPKRFWALPLDGTKTRLTFNIDGTDCDLIPVPLGVPAPDNMGLKIVLEHGVFKVSNVELSALISYEAAVFERENGEHHVYRAPEGNTVSHSSFKGQIFDLPVNFDHQENADGSKSSSATFPSGVRLSSQGRVILNEEDDI